MREESNFTVVSVATGDPEEFSAMESVMEGIDPSTWPGLSVRQRCALGRFAKPSNWTSSQSFRECVVGDSNFAAGMLLGWNLCIDGREEDFNQIRGDRMRAAAQASKGEI